MSELNVFDHNSISVEGDLVYPRVFAAYYPGMQFIEDARPDYYIKKLELDAILLEIYGTTGLSVYKSYLSGKCVDVRVIEEDKTMFFVHYYTEDDVVDRNYRLSSKDLAVINELGDIDELQNHLDQTTADEYNSRALAPFIREEEMTDAIVRVFYYPFSSKDKAIRFCQRYDELKFDRETSKAAKGLNNAIYTLAQNSMGLSLNKHYLNTDKYKDEIIDSNYNDNFKPAYEMLVEFLKSDDNGLVLLTGEPGTGKSSLLMHLTSVCKELNTRFVFIPSAFAAVLSDPAFLPFAISNLNNCVLILEDAEEVLKDRGAYGSGAVSNILNIADGILGKIVKVKLIATVNKSHVIDEAIVRQGRLRLQYEFEKLSVDKANNLFIKLAKPRTTTVPLTLAEIYNDKVVVVKPINTRKKSIGF
jgi:energy-coupling factor transporter ATP-binding protein EcfA2